MVRYCVINEGYVGADSDKQTQTVKISEGPYKELSDPLHIRDLYGSLGNMVLLLGTTRRKTAMAP